MSKILGFKQRTPSCFYLHCSWSIHVAWRLSILAFPYIILEFETVGLYKEFWMFQLLS